MSRDRILCDVQRLNFHELRDCSLCQGSSPPNLPYGQDLSPPDDIDTNTSVMPLDDFDEGMFEHGNDSSEYVTDSEFDDDDSEFSDSSHPQRTNSAGSYVNSRCAYDCDGYEYIPEASGANSEHETYTNLPEQPINVQQTPPSVYLPISPSNQVSGSAPIAQVMIDETMSTNSDTDSDRPPIYSYYSVPAGQPRDNGITLMQSSVYRPTTCYEDRNGASSYSAEDTACSSRHPSRPLRDRSDSPSSKRKHKDTKSPPGTFLKCLTLNHRIS